MSQALTEVTHEVIHEHQGSSEPGGVGGIKSEEGVDVKEVNGESCGDNMMSPSCT